MAAYSNAFYSKHMSRSFSSAKIVLPIVFEMISPKSVVDVGCGIGTWLCAAKRLGAQQAVGIDGDYVDRKLLMLPANDFVASDLSKPRGLEGRRFDLCISLEVAEHLPAESADEFVHFLATLSDTVLFSAAVPGQGGENHVNEQWPSHWAEKFASNGYDCFDCIRPLVYSNPSVESWYAQNTLLFVKRSVADRFPALEFWRAPDNVPGNVLHPARNGNVAIYRMQANRLPLGFVITTIPRIVRDLLAQRAKSFLSRN